MPALHDAWTDALPSVFRLTVGHRRDLFRHELQSFLAFSSMDRDKATQLVAPLRELLLTAARAARHPPAISTTRAWEPDIEQMAALAQHLLAQWRSAEAAALTEETRDPSGMTGEVFFGPRLGGPGREGAVRAESISEAPAASTGAPDEG